VVLKAMTRDAAIHRAEAYFASGAFREDLGRRVAIPTESQNPDRAPLLARYIEAEIKPTFEMLGFACHTLSEDGWPFLLAERLEDPARPTVLGYGHGDVIRGLDEQWADGLSPWRLTERDGRWYGRGVADNKGQHSITIDALRAVIETRGRLGFNAKYLIEMGEEAGSPGLRALAAPHRELLRAEVLIGSDGPRLAAERPTLFLSTRGCITFDLSIEARQGGHHSGNWGGLISDPALQLAHALAAIAGPTGQIQVPEWRPAEIPDGVRRPLADCEPESGPDGPTIEPDWGEPGLTLAEKVFAWCAFTILAFEAGTPKTPTNAIPPRAWARCQLRTVVGIDERDVLPALRRHLDRCGFPMARIAPSGDEDLRATRLDPDHPWPAGPPARSPARPARHRPPCRTSAARCRTISSRSSSACRPSGCRTRIPPADAPNEHLPVTLAREGLAIMAGLYWHLGEQDVPEPPTSTG
jgi:acetylornithine deacetylase/succinyl-diaminopimelate desuccinylase-like protein